MADTRPRVQLNGKVINLSQLTAEMGGAGLTASASEVVVADPKSSVKQAQLEQAVAAHVAQPPAPNPDDQLASSLAGASTAPAIRTALLSWVQARKGR